MPARRIALRAGVLALGLCAPVGPAEAPPGGFSKVVVASGLSIRKGKLFKYVDTPP